MHSVIYVEEYSDCKRTVLPLVSGQEDALVYGRRSTDQRLDGDDILTVIRAGPVSAQSSRPGIKNMES